ncbi:unnamed protein product, partial [marine sediment metagenome]
VTNFALRKNNIDVLTGKILNLNFPSKVTTINAGGQKITYGYSSGTYAKLNPMLNQVSLMPRQEEIDALGSGITRLDWEKRFELVYQSALNQPVVAAIGVTPVILSFARYVHLTLIDFTQKPYFPFYLIYARMALSDINGSLKSLNEKLD